MSVPIIGQYWQYPLAAASFRFKQINGFARDMDRRWPPLAPWKKRMWEISRKNWPWWAQCVPWIFDFDPFDGTGTTAIAAFRGVNCSRLLQGLDFVDVPPAVASIPGGDALILSLPSDFTVSWVRAEGPTGLPAVAVVRAVSATHEPESGPAISKYKFAFSAPIAYSTPLDLHPLFDALPGLRGVAFVSLAISIADLGSAPFFGQRIGFYNPVP